MKIIYQSDSLSVHDFKIIRKLAASEHEVYVVTYHGEKRLPPEVQKVNGVRKIHKNFPPYDTKTPEKYNQFLLPFRKIIGFMRACLHFRKVVRKIKPDLLHVGWVQGGGVMAALSGFHPFLLMTWGSDVLINPKKSRIVRAISRYVVKRADAIFSDANTVKKELVRNLNCPPGKVEVFHQPGVDVKMFSSGKGAKIRKRLGWIKNPIIIMTRSFLPVYGVSYFLKSLSYVKSKVPSARVILCGDGPLRKEFKDLLKAEGVDDIVHFAGYVDNKELPDYYAAADIYVSTSLSDGSSASLLEAMSSGLPVVLSGIPSNRENVHDGQNGFIVPVKDHKVLGKRLVILLKDSRLRKRFSKENSRIAKERFDISVNFKRLENLYKETHERYMG